MAKLLPLLQTRTDWDGAAGARAPHLLRVKPRGGLLSRSASVRNRFGLQTLTVTGSDSMCAPATSSTDVLKLVRGRDPAALLDSFKCYRVTIASFRARRLLVTDALRGKVRIGVRRPSLLCNPAEVRRDKKRARVRNADARLVCYLTSSAKAMSGSRLVLNPLRAVRAASPARGRALPHIDQGGAASSAAAEPRAAATSATAASTATAATAAAASALDVAPSRC